MQDGRFERVQAAFLCECGRSLCEARVAMVPREYDEAAESHPAIAPGHEHWYPEREELGECRYCRERRRVRR